MTKRKKPRGTCARGHSRLRSVTKSVVPLHVQWPELESVDRIIQATLSAPGGAKYESVRINREALRGDLDDALVQYRVAAELGSTKVADQRDRRWREIHETARRLLNLLREDTRDVWSIGENYPRKAPSPKPIIHCVALAAIACRRRLRKRAPDDPVVQKTVQETVQWMRARSPADFLAGELLSRLFIQHFEAEEAGYTTKEGDTDGAAIRFAERVFRECGITHNGRHYQRSFFAAALTNARKKRSRRKRLT
jgi:hypothetical protein